MIQSNLKLNNSWTDKNSLSMSEKSRKLKNLKLLFTRFDSATLRVNLNKKRRTQAGTRSNFDNDENLKHKSHRGYAPSRYAAFKIKFGFVKQTSLGSWLSKSSRSVDQGSGDLVNQGGPCHLNG